jgi:hypothetical protein
LAFFKVYLDDSGTDPNQPVAIAAALIIPAQQIARLSSAWDTLKEKERFSCLHISEFAARNPKSEFADWDDRKREHVAARVRQIIKKFSVKALSFSVRKSDYDELMPGEMKKFAGRYHYTWAIRYVLALTEEWFNSHEVADPLEYIFDNVGKKNTDPARVEIENVMEQAEEGAAGLYAHYSFRPRCEWAALQCADVLAWTCYQAALLAFTKKPLTPLASAMWSDFFEHSNRTWLKAVTVKREHLADWIHQELADGRSIARFRAWEERKR